MIASFVNNISTFPHSLEASGQSVEELKPQMQEFLASMEAESETSEIPCESRQGQED